MSAISLEEFKEIIIKACDEHNDELISRSFNLTMDERTGIYKKAWASKGCCPIAAALCGRESIDRMCNIPEDLHMERNDLWSFVSGVDCTPADIAHFHPITPGAVAAVQLTNPYFMFGQELRELYPNLQRHSIRG